MTEKPVSKDELQKAIEALDEETPVVLPTSDEVAGA